jgi:NitT/TauT family transport system substrate-binding protein
MERNQKIALVVIVLVVGSVGAFALLNTAPAPDVRIGYLSQDLHQLALRVAVEKGWFEEAGLTVELSLYQNGGYEMDGFRAGQIDMGYLGAAPALVKSINEGTAVTILAAVNLEGSALMVLKSAYDSDEITNITDLSGKTVFYPGPPTVQSFLLRLALNQSGMTINDITPQTTSVTYMEDSLSEDSPAFIAWEPFAAKAEASDAAVPLLLSEDIWPEHPCCVVGTSNSFLESNPEVVQKVVNIHKRAEEWIVNNPTEAIEIAVDWLEMDEGIVQTAFERIIYSYELDRTGIERYLDFLIEEDIVTMEASEADTYLDGFINTTFIEQAP